MFSCCTMTVNFKRIATHLMSILCFIDIVVRCSIFNDIPQTSIYGAICGVKKTNKMHMHVPTVWSALFCNKFWFILTW